MCNAFVGRAGEVAALQDAYRDPVVHTVLVGGEAGLGKSRLVAEFTTRLGANAAVLAGRCPESGGRVPFAPFLAVLRTLVRELGVDGLATLLPVVRPALSRWLPEQAAHSGPAEPDTDRIQLFGEILTVLEQLALTRPVVVVLEDLHWADDASRELLAFLVANLAQRDLLLVGTYRPADSAPLRRLVTGLRRDPGVLLLTPAPLTKHEVGRQLAALLGREPEPGVVARVFERSRGIPLFVEALSPAPEDTPADLSELLLSYQSGLPAEARSVLRLAAVAGSPVRHALLASATDLTEDALSTALRQLVDQQLLVATDTGYEFRHILIRDAVYDDLLPIERKRLHTSLSQILAAAGESSPDECPSGELAYHAYAAGDLPLAMAACLRAASDAESAGAHGDRVRYLDRVLELSDRAPEAATDRLGVLEHLVAACYDGGVVERGIAAADEALAAVDVAREPKRAARLHHYRAGLRNQTHSGGEHDLLAALALLPTDRPTVLRGEVLAELAAAHVFGGDTAGAERDARAAVEVAEQLGARSLAARAHAYLGLATVNRSEVAMAHFAKAHAAAKAAADPRTLLTVALWESAVLVAAGDNDTAIEVIQQGLRAAHETFRFIEAGPILLVKWAQALTNLGRWNEALDLVDESLTEQLPPLSTAALLLCHARIVLARGDANAAAASVKTAEPLLGDSHWTMQYQIQLRTMKFEIAHVAGRPQRAIDIPAKVMAAHPHEAWALVTAVARTEGMAADLDAVAAALPVTTAVDTAHRAVFRAARSGRPADWAVAVSAWRALRQPHELARSLLGSAEAELADGNRAVAGEALRAVLEPAENLAANPLAEHARQLADRAGITLDEPAGPPAQSTAPSTSGLPPREQDVLRLVAKGLSNRQIAAELFISGNTAGVHVSRILAKLGAATRTEAAATARDRGLLDLMG